MHNISYAWNEDAEFLARGASRSPSSGSESNSCSGRTAAVFEEDFTSARSLDLDHLAAARSEGRKWSQPPVQSDFELWDEFGQRCDPAGTKNAVLTVRPPAGVNELLGVAVVDKVATIRSPRHGCA